MNLGDKLQSKYRDLNPEDKKAVIEKALQKQQMKGFVGMHMSSENNRIISEMKSTQSSSRYPSTTNQEAFGDSR